MLPHFYYSPEILKYDFGPQHPLKPERLRRSMELLARYDVEPTDPGPGKIEDLLRVHSDEYVNEVYDLSEALQNGRHRPHDRSYGFGPGDNPPFAGMYEAALAYVSASARAA